MASNGTDLPTGSPSAEVEPPNAPFAPKPSPLGQPSREDQSGVDVDVQPASESHEPAPSASEGGNSTHGGDKIKFREGIHIPVLGDYKWADAWPYVVTFVRNPLNMLLIFWCILSVLAGIPIVLVDIGSLNSRVKDESTRESIVEVSTQVLNSLFVLMCLIWHPVFFRQSYQVLRWKVADQKQMRDEYNKDGFEKPHERSVWSVFLSQSVDSFAAVGFNGDSILSKSVAN